MLGQKIVEMQGKMINQRVLPVEQGSPKFESTFEVAGSILNLPAKTIVTYWTIILPNGTIYGECPNQGVVMTQSGEAATFRAAGAGKFTNAAGAASFRGAIYYASQSPALAALNGLSVVYEWDVDENGNAAFKGWEWK
jgi:hypothetical protein